MSRNLKIKSLNKLIKAVLEYKEELNTNKQILLNAANVCDQAMGNDDIAKKYIAKLNKSLEELQKTAEIVENVATALEENRQQAIDVYNNI